MVPSWQLTLWLLSADANINPILSALLSEVAQENLVVKLGPLLALASLRFL